MYSNCSSRSIGPLCSASPLSSCPIPSASTGYIPKLALIMSGYFLANSSASLFVGGFTPEQIIAFTPAFFALSITEFTSVYALCIKWQWSSISIIFDSRISFVYIIL